VRGKRVVIAGVGNTVAMFFARLLPHALLLPLIANRMQAGQVSHDSAKL
jgi:hypothetical protein